MAVERVKGKGNMLKRDGLADSVYRASANERTLLSIYPIVSGAQLTSFFCLPIVLHAGLGSHIVGLSSLVFADVGLTSNYNNDHWRIVARLF
jgi:hypothetical protein